MIVADASAVIAILAGEPEEATLVATLESDDTRLLSGLSRREAIAGLVRSYRCTVDQAAAQVDDFMQTFGFAAVPMGSPETEAAIHAYQVFGKGRHPAALNMGDCFAYACAKVHGAAMLTKGEDFGKTDLA